MKIPRLKKRLLVIPYAAVIFPPAIENRIITQMKSLYRALTGKKRNAAESLRIAACEDLINGLLSKTRDDCNRGESLSVRTEHRYGYIWHEATVLLVIEQYSVFEVRHIAALEEAHPDLYAIASPLLKAIYTRCGLPIWNAAGLFEEYYESNDPAEMAEEYGLDESCIKSMKEEMDLIRRQISGLPDDMTLPRIRRQVRKLLKKGIQLTELQRIWVRNALELIALAQQDDKDGLTKHLWTFVKQIEEVTDPELFFMVLGEAESNLTENYVQHLDSFSSSGIDVPILAFSLKDAKGLKAFERLCRMIMLLQQLFYEGGTEWEMRPKEESRKEP